MSFEIEGKDLQSLEHEAGGHRLQRIPPTERSGRVHTSTVTVAVLDAEEIKSSKIDDKDLRIEWFSGTGAGGEYRNKHQNSCRLIHIPSGLSAIAQTRSRDSSLTQARTELSNRLQATNTQLIQSHRNDTKRGQIGSGQRGDKIRTIRFQDDQAVDHRTGKKIKAKDYMRGGMYKLWNK